RSECSRGDRSGHGRGRRPVSRSGVPWQSRHGNRARAPAGGSFWRGQRPPHGVRPRCASGDRPPADGQGRGRRDVRSRARPYLRGMRERGDLGIPDGRPGSLPQGARLPGRAADPQPRGRSADSPGIRAGRAGQGAARVEDARVRGRDELIKILSSLLAGLLIPTSAPAYRPFVSTGAAVSDPREVEIELGYFVLERTGRDNTITTPSVVLNY